MKPSHCTHKLFPSCGCQHPPAVATHLIVERDIEAARKAAEPRKVGRPKTPWARSESREDKFLATLPKLVEDPNARVGLIKLVNIALCRQSFAEFVKQAWPTVESSTKLLWNWHHDLLCDVLQGVFEDWERSKNDKNFQVRVNNVLINIPPGTGKSKILSLMFPVWVWLRAPGAKFLCLSVNEDASMRDARDSRNLLQSEWFQSSFAPDWQINGDQKAISNYGNTHGGIRLSKAQGSEVVGLRCDFLLIDDPNNPMEADSKLVREAVNELWRTNIYNRVNDVVRSVRIGIQQRTHMEDWSGFVLKTQGVWNQETNQTGWLHVCLPAEFEPERRCVTPWGSDPRTIKGESLHHDRLPMTFLEAEKKRFGSMKYAGQMQQRPTLAEGGMVKMKWWNFFRYDGEEPIQQGARRLEECDRSRPSLTVKRARDYGNWDFDWTVITLDLANKKNERGSQHGILVVAGKKQQRFILDDKTCRGDILDVLAIVERLCRQYDPERIVIEAKAAGPALTTLLEDRFMKGEILGSNGKPLIVVIDPIEPQGDKQSRLDACVPQIEAGMVFLHESAGWLDPFTAEICSYPSASADDRVDSLSQALNHMKGYGRYQLPDW